MKKKDDLYTHNLNCYLFKDRVTEFNQALLEDKMYEQEKYEELQLVDESKQETIIGYINRNKPNPPAWLNKIRELFEVDDIVNSSNSIVFLVKAKNRIFAFVNGYAQAILNTSNIEWDFGVKVALNLLSFDEIRGVDARKLTLSSHQKREVSSSNSKISEFEIDFDEEFINSISGRIENQIYGSSLTGNESLKIKVKIDLKNIEDYCNKLFKLYNKNDYKKHFSFYDKLHITKDKDIYKEFKRILTESIKQGEHITFAYPNIDDFDYFSYRIVYDSMYKDYEDINIDCLYDFLKVKDIDIEEEIIDKIKISLIDDEGNSKKQYKLLNYIVYEFTYGKSKYIYTDNKILNIDKDFYEKIINDIESIEIDRIEDFTLPKMTFEKTKDKKGKDKISFEAEGAYNEKAQKANTGTASLMDKNNFRKFPDRPQDQVEIADIITKNKVFICVKSYKNSSAPLSHLFQQGFVSAELLAEEPEYIEDINKKVEGELGKNFLDTNNLNRSEITFVYAISMRKDGTLAENLPFFSKISLRQNIKDLRRFNFQLKAIKIPMEEKT